MTDQLAACDSSLLVAAHLDFHPRHGEALSAVETRLQAVPAHVLLECYSVLTRLPAPHRIDEQTAARSLAGLELELLALPAKRHPAIIRDLSSAGIRGGAVYDGLVAATVRHHRGTLLTLDRRARATYDAVGVSYEVL